MDETVSLNGDIFDASAYYAAIELHYGRLEWLAEHIKRTEGRIHSLVAEKILELIEKSDPRCFYELKAVRKSGISPSKVDSQLRRFRNFDMAILVARAGGFKRGHLDRACYEVGEKYGLKAKYVSREIRAHKELAIQIIEEEEMQAAYDQGKIDFLGHPKKP